MKGLQTVAVLVTLLILGHAIQTEYFVKPNESAQCPAPRCHTLSHYLENTTRYFTSNTRITFLQGVHEIDKSGVLLIQNVSSLTLTGYNASGSKIICKQPAILRFNHMINLVISNQSIIRSTNQQHEYNARWSCFHLQLKMYAHEWTSMDQSHETMLSLAEKDIHQLFHYSCYLHTHLDANLQKQAPHLVWQSQSRTLKQSRVVRHGWNFTN